MLKKGSRTLIVFFRVYLFIYFFDSGPVLFLSIREKDMRGKTQWSQFFVGLLSSFSVSVVQIISDKSRLKTFKASLKLPLLD